MRVGCRLDVMIVFVIVYFLLDDYCGVDDRYVNSFCLSIPVSDKQCGQIHFQLWGSIYRRVSRISLRDGGHS